MPVREAIYEPGQPISHVYFPHSGVYSLLNVMSDGSAVEFATIGNEGMIGVPVLLEAESFPSRAFCQIESEAHRMPVAAFREAVRRSGTLQTLLHRYTLALFNQVAQSVACNRLHPLEERCARWLLMTHDRVPGDQFA